MDIGGAKGRLEADLAALATSNQDLTAAHEAGKLEAVAQTLAVIGQVEGGFRTDADGDSQHPSFRTADVLRELSLMIRHDVADPQTRSALEVRARAEEALDLSNYVMEVSAAYSLGNDDVSKALVEVAGDIRKGTDGVNRMRQAGDVGTDPDDLAELVLDADQDVRWWAAQNPSTPAAALAACIQEESNHLVIAALLNNPNLPDDGLDRFLKHSSPDVSRAAQRRVSDAGAK